MEAVSASAAIGRLPPRTAIPSALRRLIQVVRLRHLVREFITAGQALCWPGPGIRWSRPDHPRHWPAARPYTPRGIVGKDGKERVMKVEEQDAGPVLNRLRR